ncbi:MAG TPA: nucleotide sugar dehydrogenase [Terriglobia bacterium]|nr:nucleotide sugar dehydrogenase [Terriglobia bacterium]
MMESTVSIIGLGKLGIPMAACLAAKGLSVIGVDVDPGRVEAINRGRAPIVEPALDSLIKDGRSRLTATQDIETAVRSSQITFVVVPTPSEPDGSFSLRHVAAAAERVGRVLRTKRDPHLVVITSTVLPGSTDGEICTILEQRSGKSCGAGFGLCYNPEFIALGSVIHDFLNPDFILIGESDTHSGATLEALYKRVCENEPPVARMGIINAELTKLAVNTYVTTKISFANMLSRICARLPGADVDVVTKALGLDTRIGGKYLRGSISYGGPCFPRDNRALAALAHRIGASADLAETTDRFNREHVLWLAGLTQSRLNGGAVGILGLTYKPNTDVVEAAVGVLLSRELASRGVEVTVYDPAGTGNAKCLLGENVRVAASAAECIRTAEVVVLATAWPEFSELPEEAWTAGASARTVIDCWQTVGHLRTCPGISYVRLGAGEYAVSVLTNPPVEAATSVARCS